MTFKNEVHKLAFEARLQYDQLTEREYTAEEVKRRLDHMNKLATKVLTDLEAGDIEVIPHDYIVLITKQLAKVKMLCVQYDTEDSIKTLLDDIFKLVGSVQESLSSKVEVHETQMALYKDMLNEDSISPEGIMPDETTNGLQICPLLTIASCSLPQPEGPRKCLGTECMMYEYSRDDCRLARLPEVR